MNFYPAYKYEDVINMDSSVFFTLIDAMDCLKAQKNLQDCYTLDYSNSKEQGRRKYIRKMSELAFPWQYNSDGTASAEQIAKVFGNG